MVEKKQVSIAPYTTFKLSGLAERLVEVDSEEELVSVIKGAVAGQIPYRLIAGGSNVVFPPNLPGLTIVYRISEEGRIGRENNKLIAEAGVLLSDLVATAIRFGLAGLEALSGIPGTVGGAVIGNAGAYGQSISDHLKKIKFFDPITGEVKWTEAKNDYFSYRDSIFKKNGLIILAMEFELNLGNRVELEKKSKEIIAIRSKKYNESLYCPGSFFKNVLISEVSSGVLNRIDQQKIIDGKIPAGYLLEMVGAKGMRVGGIYVADFHGNLIINDGTGTYQEVLSLVNKLKSLVKERFKIDLEEEVRYMI